MHKFNTHDLYIHAHICIIFLCKEEIIIMTIQFIYYNNKILLLQVLIIQNQGIGKHSNYESLRKCELLFMDYFLTEEMA